LHRGSTEGDRGVNGPFQVIVHAEHPRQGPRKPKAFQALRTILVAHLDVVRGLGIHGGRGYAERVPLQGRDGGHVKQHELPHLARKRAHVSTYARVAPAHTADAAAADAAAGGVAGGEGLVAAG